MDRPPTGEPEKEKEEEREEKKKKEKKKRKKNSSGRLCYWACSVRRALPRAGSARRVLRAAAGAGPGGERRAAKGSLGPVWGSWGPDGAPRETALGCLPLRSRLSCCWVHFVSCTLGKRRFTGAGRGPPRPGRRLEGVMLTRPRLGRCIPAHAAPELMVLVGAGAYALWPGGPAETQGAAARTSSESRQANG